MDQFPKYPGGKPEGQVVRWADEAMYAAVPLAEAGEPLRPQVTLLSMTANPLRLMAATAEMYRGVVVRDPDEITREQALEWLSSALKSKIVAPLEWVQFAFLFEGVSRAFTHQLVRQRAATFVQESMRFSVRENARNEVTLPPSLEGLPEDHPWRRLWDAAVIQSDVSYNGLVAAGMPAEDARGLLVTNIGTRIHYRTDLRHLADTAENRLCSQAQYEWKIVWNGIFRAILEYGPESERWQQVAICSMFRPPCYRTGKCEFMGRDDRWCVIRDRVEAHHAAGRPPEEWYDIDPMEPLQPGAARRSARDVR